MKPNRPESDPLAGWTENVLRQLPRRPAPSSLMPRVLAELHRRRSLPWYRRPWLTWPRWPKVFSVMALVSAVVSISLLWGPGARVAATQSGVVQSATQSLDVMRALAEGLRILAQGLLQVLQQVSPWTLTALMAAGAVAWFGTLGLGTVAWRIARLNR